MKFIFILLTCSISLLSACKSRSGAHSQEIVRFKAKLTSYGLSRDTIIADDGKSIFFDKACLLILSPLELAGREVCIIHNRDLNEIIRHENVGLVIIFDLKSSDLATFLDGSSEFDSLGFITLQISPSSKSE
jgi:hypothetical protein